MLVKNEYLTKAAADTRCLLWPDLTAADKNKLLGGSEHESRQRRARKTGRRERELADTRQPVAETTGKKATWKTEPSLPDSWKASKALDPEVLTSSVFVEHIQQRAAEE